MMLRPASRPTRTALFSDSRLPLAARAAMGMMPCGFAVKAVRSNAAFSARWRLKSLTPAEPPPLTVANHYPGIRANWSEPGNQSITTIYGLPPMHWPSG